mgnify:CR=1 FL=1
MMPFNTRFSASFKCYILASLRPIYMIRERTFGEKLNEIPFDYSEYFTTKYWVLWVFLLVLFPPLFFIWFPLQIYFFFFHWPEDQISADGSQTERNRHDGASPPFNHDREKKDPKGDGKSSWWGLEDAPDIGQDLTDDEWWKRI